MDLINFYNVSLTATGVAVIFHIYDRLKYYYNSFGMVMLRDWTQCDYQKSWLTGNLKEGKNEAAPEEPGKM